MNLVVDGICGGKKGAMGRGREGNLTIGVGKFHSVRGEEIERGSLRLGISVASDVVRPRRVQGDEENVEVAASSDSLFRLKAEVQACPDQDDQRGEKKDESVHPFFPDAVGLSFFDLLWQRGLSGRGGLRLVRLSSFLFAHLASAKIY